MRKLIYVSLMSLLSLMVAKATPQTSDADLKMAQNPIVGATVFGVTDALADAAIFSGCTFVGPSVGSSGHPVKVAGATTVTNDANLGSLSENSGAILTGTMTSLTVAGSNASVNFTEATATLQSGSTPLLYLTSSTGGGIAAGSVFVGDQVSPISVSITTSGSAGSNMAVTVDSCASLTLASCSLGDVFSEMTISAAAATTVDVSGYAGAAVSTQFSLTCNASALTLPPALAGGPYVDTWNGPFDYATVNAILNLYINAGVSGSTITLGGPSISPDPDLVSTLTGLGNTVTTN